MKKFKQIILFLFTILILPGCGEVKWIKTNLGGFTMDLPSYMQVSEEFIAPGKVFLENTNREIYLIIERRHRSEVFSQGMEFRIESLQSPEYSHLSLAEGCAGKYRESETGQLPEGGNLYSLEGIIECGDSIFLLQMSTTADNRKDWYKEDFLRVFNSFKKN